MTKEKAIELFGSGRKLAAALNISPQAIYQMPKGEIKDPRGAHVRIVAAERGLISPIGKREEEAL